MKYLTTAVSLVGFLIAAAWYIPTLTWSYQVTEVVAKMQAGEEGDFGELLKGPAPLRWLRERSELNATYSLTDLNIERTITYKIQQPFEHILNPNESMPQDAYLELYAAARAPQVLMSFCDEIIATLATRCVVGRSKGRILSRNGSLNEGDNLEVSGRLRYAPSYDYGDPSTVENGKLVNVRIGTRMLDRHADLQLTPAQIYAKALEICATITREFGNCVIGNISLSWSSQHPTLSDAGFVFTIYADTTKHAQSSLQERAESIAKRVLF